MKNYLIAIDNEIQDYYKQFTNNVQNDTLQFESNVNELCENIVAVLDYYVNPIFNNGKAIIARKVGISIIKDNFNEDEEQFINEYKTKDLKQFVDTLKMAILSCYEERQDDKTFYEQIIEIIIGKCIKLFKLAQLMEYKNNDIKSVALVSDSIISCPICQTKSKFLYKVDKLLNEVDDFHPFCKLNIEPAYNNNVADLIINKSNIKFIGLPMNLHDQMKAFITKLKIFIPEMIEEKTFTIVDDISNQSEFIVSLQKKFNENQISNIQSKVNAMVALYEYNGNVLIDKKYLNNIEYLILNCLLKTKLLQADLSWWDEEYSERQKSKYIGDDVSVYAKPFISYIAEQDSKSYFLESAINYILNPEILKNIDLENYNKLKSSVFNNSEFLKG